MEWLQITIYTTTAGIEPVSGRLYQLGITGLEIEDESDFLDFLENNKQYWDYVDDELRQEKSGETCVKAYVTDNASGHEMLLAIRNTLNSLKQYDKAGEFGRLELSIGNLSEEDWANNWKKYFHVMPVGKRIMIKPEWEDITEETDRVVFSINPGMTFGTGSHYTTRLCIEALENIITPETDLLDLGCGSGILSLISLLLGAHSATAVDIDPNCVHIAYENADRNNIDRTKYRVLAGNALEDDDLKSQISDTKYDIVVANIVADVIIAYAPLIPAFIKKGGTFIASGIITDRADEVKSVLEQQGFYDITVAQSKDWIEMTCKY